MTKPNSPIPVFIAYSRQDEAILTQLRSHLAVLERTQLIETWYDGEIEFGSNWEKAIKDALHNAQIILLLISADFLDSDYAYETEMKQALQMHEEEKARVLPVILRSCLWQYTPFARLQVLPKDGKPVKDGQFVSDSLLQEVANAVAEIAHEIKAHQKAALGAVRGGTGNVPKSTIYAAFIKGAQKLFAEQKWQKAAEKYQQSLHYLEADSQPTRLEVEARIQQCNIEMGFAEHMRLGKVAFEVKDWSNALHAFDEALRLKPENVEIQELQRRTQSFIAEEQQSQKALAFNAAIAKAQQFLRQKKWAEAETSYQQAYNLWEVGLIPTRQDIQEQNNFIKTEIALAEQLRLANRYYTQKDFKTALKHYSSALELKYSPEINQQKIACEDQIKTARNQAIAGMVEPAKRYGSIAGGLLLLLLVIWGGSKAIPSIFSSSEDGGGVDSLKIDSLIEVGGVDSTVLYTQFLQQAQDLFDQKTYQQAIQYADSALQYKAEDGIALKLQKEAEAAQSQQSAAEQRKAEEATYKKIIQIADTKFKAQDWLGAKSQYETAAALKPNDNYPEHQLKKIEEKLDEIAQANANREEQAKKDSEYNRLVALADDKYNKQEWVEAKDYYQRAAKYKNTEHVKERIAGIDWRLKQEEGRKEYNRLVKLADEKYEQEDWIEAKKYYEEAAEYYNNRHVAVRIQNLAMKINQMNAKEEVFTNVEKMPEFPEGEKEMYRFIEKNLKYPPMARKKGIQGNVYVGFIVEKNGTLSNVQVKRGITGGGSGCEEEAIRIIKQMPKWTPGKQRGKTVRVSYTLPIRFKLE